VGDFEWGHIPQRRVSAPVGLPRNASKHVCINTSECGTSYHGVYRHDPPSGAHPSNREVFPPLTGENSIIGVYGWTNVITTSEWGIPINGGFSWPPSMGAHPIIKVNGWMYVETASERGNPINRGGSWPPLSRAIPSTWRVNGWMYCKK